MKINDTTMKVRELYEQGYTDKEIADKLMYTREYVAICRQELALPADNLPVTKGWLERSGKGAEWDRVCAGLRRACGC